MNFVFPPTGLAALAKSPYPTFGDDNRMPPGQRRDKGGNDDPKKKQGGGADRIPAFMPGQKDALASQLDQGFGGGDAQWRAYLSKVYAASPGGGFKPGMGGGMGFGLGGPMFTPTVTKPGGAVIGYGSTGLSALGGNV